MPNKIMRKWKNQKDFQKYLLVSGKMLIAGLIMIILVLVILNRISASRK